MQAQFDPDRLTYEIFMHTAQVDDETQHFSDAGLPFVIFVSFVTS